MKFFIAALALVAVGVNAQSTVTAPCGTSCPSAIPDKTITRSYAATTESPCPSLIVSGPGAMKNGTSPSATGVPTASPSAFTGGAGHLAGSVGAVVAAAVVAIVL